MPLLLILAGWACIFTPWAHETETVFYVIGACVLLNVVGITWGLIRATGRWKTARDTPNEYDLQIRDPESDREYKAILSIFKRK